MIMIKVLCTVLLYGITVSAEFTPEKLCVLGRSKFRTDVPEVHCRTGHARK
jgi:hypothetical protein